MAQIFGGPRVPKAERVIDLIDALVLQLSARDPGGTEQVLAIQEAGHAASFAVAAMVWAYQGSEVRAREIERRALAAFHQLAGGMSLREKQFAVLQTLNIAACQERLRLQTPKEVLTFFSERVNNVIPKSRLRTLKFEEVAAAIEAAARRPGRRRGARTGQRSPSKYEVLNDFLNKLGIGAASGEALEKAQEREPEIPRLPE